MNCPNCNNSGYDEEHGYCSVCEMEEIDENEEKIKQNEIEKILEFEEPDICPNCKQQGWYDGTYCDKCMYGYSLEEIYQKEIESRTETAEEAYKTSPNIVTPKKQGDLITYIEDALNEKFENVIDPTYIHAFSLFLTSLSLNKVVYPDGLGNVYPNLFCFVLGRSGSFKTPLINLIDRGMFNGFNRMEKSSDFTPEALYELAATWIRRFQTGAYPLLSAIDEMTTLLKNSLAGSFKANIPETLCKSFDNKIEGGDTKGDLRIGIKKKFIPTYHCLIGASTDYFLKMADESWWISGLFNRPIWVYIDTAKMPPITTEDMERVYETIDTQFFKDVNDHLTFLQNCTNVVLPKDSLAYKIWSKWSAKILNENRIQDSFLATYKTKQNVLALKLAIIHAASRDSINKVSDTQYDVVIQEEDIEWAINDIETIWFPQADETIKRWQYVTGNAEESTEDKIVSWIRSFILTDKEKIEEKRRIYSVTSERIDKGMIVGDFQKNIKGEWIMKSDLKDNHHSKRYTTEKFNRDLTEAIKAGLVEEGRDIATRTVYLRIKNNMDADEAFQSIMQEL